MIERARALASERRLENVTWIAGDVEPLSIVVSRLALAHSTACSIDCAWIKVKPAMSSLLSRNAPSVTEIWPAALRTRLPRSAVALAATLRPPAGRAIGHLVTTVAARREFDGTSICQRSSIDGAHPRAGTRQAGL
jgi:hypothetical protein